MNNSAPRTHAEIMLALTRSKQVVAAFFGAIDARRFFAHPDDVWSAAENLEHLIKAVRPLATALRLPKLLTRVAFGGGRPGPRSYDDIASAYVELLQQGGTASGRALPSIDMQSADAQRELLSDWRVVNDKLLNTLRSWSDDTLDQQQLPHPLLGKLTVREMLFFTLYHNGHHVAQAREVLSSLTG
jgi:DinB superfamily